MIRFTPAACLLLALLTTPCLAQESKPQAEPKAQQPDDRSAVARKEFDELKLRFDTELADYIATHAALLRRGQREQADKHRRENRPAENYMSEFLEGARKYDGSPAAAPFLGWLVSSSQWNEILGKQAMAILFAEHLTSLEMRSLLSIAGLPRRHSRS